MTSKPIWYAPDGFLYKTVKGQHMRENNKKHYTIAIMIGSVQSDYAQEMMRGFYAGAAEENVNLALMMGPQIPSSCADIIAGSLSGDYQYQFNSIYEYTHFVKPDAIIIVYDSLSNYGSEWSKESFLEKFSDIPCLMVEDQPFNEKVPSYTANNYSGMKACIKHLVADHGYKKVAFLSGPKENYAAQERLRAYRDVMAEYGCPVTDGMVAYGDFTDVVDRQILYLLEQTPDLEAIACADDIMAQACYRVLGMQNLIVGRDIAVTGFDDTLTASTLNPPLTSVSQNIFQISYAALKNAVAVCRGEAVYSGTMPAMLRKRCSCGCTPTGGLKIRHILQEELHDFVETALAEMSSYVFASVSYEKVREHLENLLKTYCFYIYETVIQQADKKFQMGRVVEIVRGLISYPCFPNELLLKSLTQFIQVLIANAPSVEAQKLLVAISAATQQMIHSHNIETLKHEIFTSDRKTWFVPMFTRDLVCEAYLHNPKEIFYRVMTELKKMSIKSTYFFLFDKTVGYVPGRWLEFPEEIKLVAYYERYEMRYYPPEEQPGFSIKTGIMPFVDGCDPATFMAMVLFSEHRQYGIMLCEVNNADISFLQICSVQLGSLFHFIEIDQMEQQAQQQLENSLQVIREQNRILSFLSEYDELTKLLNRRGFIERALALYEKSAEKQAYLIFGDLDHLKEINDVFGHNEGDFAIKNIAERFSTILPPSAVIGRIGGDEFVAFVLTDEENFAARMEQAFADVSKHYNSNSDKPYYIEASIGVYGFICNPEEDFDDTIRKSDQLLYLAKASRRRSIRKMQAKEQKNI